MGIGTGTATAPTWFENLVAQRQVLEPEFSFFFGRVLSGSDAKSLLTIGGREQTRFEGPVYQAPVSDAGGHWQIAINDVQVSANSAGVSTVGEAAIDTGTNIIIAPLSAAAATFGLIPGSYGLDINVAPGQRKTTAYVYPCNTDKVVAFGVAGQWLDVAPEDFNMGRFSSFRPPFGAVGRLSSGLRVAMRYQPYCTSAILGADIRSTAPNGRVIYILGQTFLRSWYTIFRTDGPTVSFAKAVHT